MTTAAPGITAFGAFARAHQVDPYPFYREAREEGALLPYLLDDVPVHLVTRYTECAQVLTSPDWGHGYAEGISPFRDPGARIPGSFVRMDPPEHTRLRGLLSRSFLPRAIGELAPTAARVVEGLLDEALAAGGLDAIGGLSEPLAAAMVQGRLLGVPEADRAALRTWELAIARGTDPDDLLDPADMTARTEAAQACLGYFAELVARRRREPGDDLLSALAAGVGDGVISAPEVVGIALLLLVAGTETSVNLIGNGVLALLRDPTQQALLRERPDLVPAAVDEVLRHDAPTQFTIRVALRDTEVGGRTFRRGDGVVVLMASASRDERVFTDPDSFDVTRYAGRRPARRHLGFSLGLHFCLGAPLARLEAEASLRALLARTERLELATADLDYLPSLIHRGVRELPVAVSGRGRQAVPPLGR
ncbi:cytochrome P450 [Pseudonocardia xishanensis]|uniref:Cytochrome P450 n=1 Tax=Pseudonocardia xishanensis TaxID=630995 RepID=A0ABP8S3S4_9PSEU